MSETPEDLSLPSHDAGALFRAEMAAQNFVLGYWKFLVGAVVGGLVLILIYGQTQSGIKARQQGYAAEVARVELPVAQILPNLATQPALVSEGDLAKVEAAATALLAIGAEASGPAAAEAYMKAGELFRLLDQPEQQLIAYEGAVPLAAGDMAFAAASARASLLLNNGSADASVAAWRELSAAHDGFLGAFATLQLARTQRSVGDAAGAIASYDSLMSRFPESDLTTTASDERAGLSTAAPSAPAPEDAPPALVPAPEREEAPTETP